MWTIARNSKGEIVALVRLEQDAAGTWHDTYSDGWFEPGDKVETSPVEIKPDVRGTIVEL